MINSNGTSPHQEEDQRHKNKIAERVGNMLCEHPAGIATASEIISNGLVTGTGIGYIESYYQQVRQQDEENTIFKGLDT